MQATDFSAYFDLVQLLRARGIPFVPVAGDEDVPASIGVLVLTGPPPAVPLPTAPDMRLVPFTTPERTLEAALHALDGGDAFQRIVIGIDPGERPGVAVLADGRVVKLVHARSPEAVRPAIDAALDALHAEKVVIRIGDGAPTFRDRILQTLAGMPFVLELVDESNSTPASYHGAAERDTQAATRIALTPGLPVSASDVGPVIPTEGELRDIQRKSRLASAGKVTIPRALARRVALGRLTLDEAVQRHLGKA